jgi:hypothetical protein
MAATLAAPKHRLLLEDEGNATLHLVDENGGPGWTTALPGNGRDLQLIGGNRVLAAAMAGGYFEIDLADGAIRKTILGFGAVQSARRLPDGHTLLAGNDLDGSKGIVALDLDPADKQVAKTVFPGMGTLRLMRLTADGHLLFGSAARLIEADRQGNILWETALEDAVIYKALRLKNGNTWASTGYSATLALTSPDKQRLRTLGGTAMPKEVNAHFFADFQCLPNGNLMVANWQNHGPGHGGEGTQALEFDSTGALVWQFHQDPAKFSSLHGVLVLDGLDTRLGHDERDGAQTPWAPLAVLAARPAHRSAGPWTATAFPWLSRCFSPDGRSVSAP